MLRRRTDETQIALENTITELQNDMKTRDGDSEEYATMLNRLERLMKLKEKNSPKQINPDTWLIVGGNLAGILIIVSYEHGRVITSKALSFAGKLR